MSKQSLIRIIENKEPQLRRPKFNVDGKLDSKLDDYEITSLMNKSNFSLFLGRAGSGKSSLVISFLNTPSLFRKVYHTIILFMPPNSRASIQGGFFDKNLPQDQIYDELNVENLQAAYDLAKENANEGFKTLVIFDDVQKFFKGECEKLLLHMVNNRRHAHLSLWCVAQTYKSIPPQVRQGFTDLFVFKINKKEMENIFEEQIEQLKDKFIDILKFVFKEPHDFMYINTESQRIFSNWDELIIEE